MVNCAVPEKIHTHPIEGHQKFQGGGGLKSQTLEAKYEAKLEFPGGGGGMQNKKPSIGGRMNIFWKCAFRLQPFCSLYDVTDYIMQLSVLYITSS